MTKLDTRLRNIAKAQAFCGIFGGDALLGLAMFDKVMACETQADLDDLHNEACFLVDGYDEIVQLKEDLTNHANFALTYLHIAAERAVEAHLGILDDEVSL